MARIYRHDPLRVPEEALCVATWDEDGKLLDPDGEHVPIPTLPTMAEGDILYHNGTALVKLAVGTSGQVLTVVEGAPAWVTPST